MSGMDVGLLEGAEARSWSLGIVEQTQFRVAIDCEEMDQGSVREEIVVGNACGVKPSSHGSKAILLSHGWSHHHSLSPHAPASPASAAK